MRFVLLLLCLCSLPAGEAAEVAAEHSHIGQEADPSVLMRVRHTPKAHAPSDDKSHIHRLPSTLPTPPPAAAAINVVEAETLALPVATDSTGAAEPRVEPSADADNKLSLATSSVESICDDTDTVSICKRKLVEAAKQVGNLAKQEAAGPQQQSQPKKATAQQQTAAFKWQLQQLQQRRDMQQRAIAHKRQQVEQLTEIKHRQQEAAVTEWNLKRLSQKREMQLQLLHHKQDQLHLQQAQIMQREQRAKAEQQQSAALQWQLKKLEEKRDMQLHMLAHEQLNKAQHAVPESTAAVVEKPASAMQLQQMATPPQPVTQTQTQAVLKWNLQQLRAKKDAQMHLLQLAQQSPQQQYESTAVAVQRQPAKPAATPAANPPVSTTVSTNPTVAAKPSDQQRIAALAWELNSLKKKSEAQATVRAWKQQQAHRQEASSPLQVQANKLQAMPSFELMEGRMEEVDLDSREKPSSPLDHQLQVLTKKQQRLEDKIASMKLQLEN